MGQRLGLLSRRYWRRRAGRAIATVLGVALGVALMAAVAVVNRSILASYTGVIDTLAGRAELQVLATGDGGFPAAVLERVRKVPGVEVAAPVLARAALLRFRDDWVRVTVWGIDPELDSQVRPVRLAAGRFLEPGEEGSILLTEALAEGLGIRVGDRIEVMATEGRRTYRVVGVYTGLGPAGATVGDLAVLPINEAQALFTNAEGRLTQIDIVPVADEDLDTLASRLREQVGDLAQVVRPAQRGKDVEQMLVGVRFMLAFASVIALLAAAYLIANNAGTSVEDRRRELAIVRALGASAPAVRRWMVGEALFAGLVGSALGLLWGLALAGVVAQRVSETLLAVFRLEISQLELPVTDLLLAAGVGVVTTVVAARSSALRASRVPPAEAFRTGVFARSMELGEGRPRRYWALAMVLFGGLGLVLLFIPGIAAGLATESISSLGVFFAVVAIVGVTGYAPAAAKALGTWLTRREALPSWFYLAADSLRRFSGRAGSAAAALTVTLAILIGVYGMVHSYQREVRSWANEMFGWDLFVSTGFRGFTAEAPLNPQVGEDLAAIPGVALVSPDRFTFVDYESTRTSLYAFDMERFPYIRRFRSLEGTSGEELPKVLQGTRRVAVSLTFASLHEVGPGDRIRLVTPTGEHSYEVVAVVYDFGPPTGSIFMDRATYVRDFEDTAVDAFALKLAEGAHPDAVVRAIRERMGERYPLQILSAADFKADITRMVEEAFGPSQALVMIAVLVALFGLANAGLIAVWQLRRELATLRAIGAPPGLLARTLLAETWITGLLGGIGGVVLGTLLSGVLVQGMRVAGGLMVSWSLPLEAYGMAGAIAVLGSLLAGWLPYRVAMRTPLTEALRYE